MSLQCVLGRCQPVKPDAEQIKRDGWREHGILVVHRDDSRLDLVHREMVRQIGNQLYEKGKQ